jgi:hypothetical protein
VTGPNDRQTSVHDQDAAFGLDRHRPFSIKNFGVVGNPVPRGMILFLLSRRSGAWPSATSGGSCRAHSCLDPRIRVRR